jgi:DNA-binding NarL/FixJ family response regulator
VIAEDFVLIQRNIRRVIEADCEIVGEVEDGEAALRAVADDAPDILLLDVSLPDMSGFAVAEQLKAANSPVKIIIVSAHGDRNYIERAFQLGAKGYILKGKIWTDLPAAIREVSSGGSYRSPLIP